MDQSKPSFFITTPIYYVNADPHLGTAYSTIIADVQARYRRSAGYNVKFLTGMDEHGEKVAEAAAKHNMTPQEWTDSQAPHFKELWNKLEISNDDFIRTTEPRQHHAVQYLWERMKESGYLYKGSYDGWYCVPDETYFIPLRIESVSSCMASTTKNYVLFEILRKNDYATTKSDTYYTMTGTTQSGWVIDNIFGSDSRRQAINSSKLVTPVGKHSIRILPGATAETEALDIRNNSIRITVDPETWVNVPIYVEGELTDETVPMQKVTIEPYLDSQDAISVSASPTDVSAYDPATGTFYLYYRYKYATESGNNWQEVRETMTRTEY